MIGMDKRESCSFTDVTVVDVDAPVIRFDGIVGLMSKGFMSDTATIVHSGEFLFEKQCLPVEPIFFEDPKIRRDRLSEEKNRKMWKLARQKGLMR